MTRRLINSLLLPSLIFGALSAWAQAPSTQPVAVDNRPGSSTYKKVTVPADFWSTADPLQLALGTGQHYAIVSATGALVNPSASAFYAANPPPASQPPDAATMAASLESARLYPVFILPMGPGYYDFELKATITNYASGQMVYWYASAIDSQPTYSFWDANPKIFYTNPESAEPRAWRLSNPSASIYSQLGGGAANSKIGELVVIPSKISGSTAWMFKGNANLVWSYVRISATGFERDAANNLVWHPIVPVEWRTAPINP